MTGRSLMAKDREGKLETSEIGPGYFPLFSKISALWMWMGWCRCNTAWSRTS